MDGQLDLFAANRAMKNVDGILERLKGLDIQLLTPLDALNILHDLQQKAARSGSSQPDGQSGGSPGRESE